MKTDALGWALVIVLALHCAAATVSAQSPHDATEAPAPRVVSDATLVNASCSR